MLRTHEAGTLRADHASQTVTLTGWVARRRDHGGVAFPLTCVTRREWRRWSFATRSSIRSGAHDLRNEYCVKVTGEVRNLEGNANTDLPTGEIEVVATDLRS